MMFSRLYTLLLVVVAVGASWAAFGAVGGTAASTILASLAVYIWAGKSPWSRYFQMAAPAIWLVAVIGLLFPAIQAARQAAWDSTSGVLSGLLPPDVSGASWQPKHNPADDLYREPARISLPHCIGLPVWILAVGLLICHVVRHRGRIG